MSYEEQRAQRIAENKKRMREMQLSQVGICLPHELLNQGRAVDWANALGNMPVKIFITKTGQCFSRIMRHDSASNAPPEGFLPTCSARSRKPESCRGREDEVCNNHLAPDRLRPVPADIKHAGSGAGGQAQGTGQAAQCSCSQGIKACIVEHRVMDLCAAHACFSMLQVALCGSAPYLLHPGAPETQVLPNLPLDTPFSPPHMLM